jgi:hypothetical protein
VLAPCRDAPAAVSSSPATGSTRRTPSARTRAWTPVRPAHPSAVPRPGRGTLLRATPQTQSAQAQRDVVRRLSVF